jgi:TPR repeat protein
MYSRALLRLNHYPAANYLAILYAKGNGVERDPQMAKELFEFAIGAGEDEPMYGLGLLLLREREVQDLAASAMWATLAAERNPAGNGGKLLKALEEMAGPAVVAEGRARAAAWQRKPCGLTVVSRGPDENEFGGLSFSE